MQIRIIGAGNMARGIATRALSGGHTVQIIDREPDKAARLAAGLQENTAAADVQAAAQYAAALSGQRLADISNPVDFSTSGGLRPSTPGPSSAPAKRFEKLLTGP